MAEEQIAELSGLCGFDDDLAAQLTQVQNRLRGLLTQIHPSLERVLGPRLAHPVVIDLLGRYPTPAALQRAGRGHVRTRLKKLAPRMAERLTDDIFGALAEQTTVVTGTSAAEHIVGRLAAQLQQLTQQRADIETAILTVVDAHPLTEVRTSMSGTGFKPAARILAEAVDRAFKSAAHLTSYDGIALVTSQAGTSVHGKPPSRPGIKYLNARCFCRHLRRAKASRVYYDKKCAEGKGHNQAIITLGKPRSDVLFAMLRDGTFHESHPAQLAPAA